MKINPTRFWWFEWKRFFQMNRFKKKFRMRWAKYRIIFYLGKKHSNFNPTNYSKKWQIWFTSFSPTDKHSYTCTHNEKDAKNEKKIMYGSIKNIGRFYFSSYNLWIHIAFLSIFINKKKSVNKRKIMMMIIITNE